MPRFIFGMVIVVMACQRATPRGSPRERVDGCLRALDAVRDEPHRFKEAFASACARALFPRERCGEAWAKAARAPHDEMRIEVAVAVEACHEAYCADLSPRPAVCARRIDAGRGAMMAWMELGPAILAHELGPEEAARIRPRLRAAFDQPAPEADGADRPVLRIFVGAKATWIGASNGWTTCVAASDMAALARALATRKEPVVEIAPAADVAYGTLVEVMDVARRARQEVRLATVEDTMRWPATPAAECPR